MGKKKLTGSYEDGKVLVEDVIKSELGLTPEYYNRTEDETSVVWVLPDPNGGIVYMSLNRNTPQEAESFRIVEPISKLPEENIMPFYRKCLDLNFYAVDCWMAMSGEDLILINQRPILGLDKEEVLSTLGNMFTVAEAVRTRFYEEFGADIWTPNGLGR